MISKQTAGNIIDLSGRRTETREQAVERLFREHEVPLRSFLLGRVRHEAELEDVVQEVFSRLMQMTDLCRRLPVNNPQNQAFIFQVANNYLVDLERRTAVRRRYQTAQVDQVAEAVFELSPDIVVESRQELSRVKDAILSLKPAWRKAFTLHRFRGLSHKDIADEMMVTIKQVEHYIANALVKIREATAVKSETGQSRGGNK